MSQRPSPVVAVLCESDDARATLGHTIDTLAEFGVAARIEGVTDRGALPALVDRLEGGGAAVFIVADATADPLSSHVAGRTIRPVLGVPLEAPGLPALDALRATTRGGGGAPVGALAIGKAGAVNAALLAVAILANDDAALARKLQSFRDRQTAKVLADRLT